MNSFTEGKIIALFDYYRSYCYRIDSIIKKEFNHNGNIKFVTYQETPTLYKIQHKTTIREVNTIMQITTDFINTYEF